MEDEVGDDAANGEEHEVGEEAGGLLIIRPRPHLHRVLNLTCAQ